MSYRTSLPAQLTPSGRVTSPTLSRSGQGVTFRESSNVTQQPAGSRIVTPSAQVSSPAVEVASVAKTESMPKSGECRFSISPMLITVLILIFVAVFVILYMTRSNLVTDLINGERIINGGKLVFWTILISIVISVVVILGVVFLRTRVTI